MTGSIKNPPCHIWIQRTTTTMRGGVRVTLRRRKRKKDHRGQQDQRQGRDCKICPMTTTMGSRRCRHQSMRKMTMTHFLRIRSRSPRQSNHRRLPHRQERWRRGADISLREITALSSDQYNEGVLLMLKELHDLPPKILHRQCCHLGLDASLLIRQV